MDRLLDEVETASTLDAALAAIIAHFAADSGTIHMMGSDGALRLKAASAGMPPQVLEIIKIVPVGKGMAGLAAQRREAVTVCNLQTDTSGDVRPGAKATGLEGAIVVPIFAGNTVAGTLGIANRQSRTFSEAEIQRLIDCGRKLARWQEP